MGSGGCPWILIGHAIDLNLGIDDHARLNTGARRGMLTEVYLENKIECGEVAWIVEPDAATHYMLGSIARLGENRQQINDRLP